jgi:subtilisin family serine protease
VLSTIPTYFEYVDSQDADGNYQPIGNYPWYAYWCGTSMATPHISGTAAKILSDGRYNGIGISQSDSDYVKGIMLGYAQNNPVTEVNGLTDEVLQGSIRRIAGFANKYAGTPPGEYYSAMLDAVVRGDDTMVIPSDPHNNCLAGHGVPRLPEGST